MVGDRAAVTAPSDEDGSYLVAVSDMMVGLLFVFIIMLAAFGLSYRSAEEQATDTEAALLEELDQVAHESRRLAEERDHLAAERDEVAAERDRIAAERNRVARDRDRL